MGFGHAVYKTEDPRATHLRHFRKRWASAPEIQNVYISLAVEETVKRLKGLNANVDFYSASTYYMMGIPMDLFTPISLLAGLAVGLAHFGAICQ